MKVVVKIIKKFADSLMGVVLERNGRGSNLSSGKIIIVDS